MIYKQYIISFYDLFIDQIFLKKTTLPGNGMVLNAITKLAAAKKTRRPAGSRRAGNCQDSKQPLLST
jgi:hypothetical protein